MLVLVSISAWTFMNDSIENSPDRAANQVLFERPDDPIDALLIRFREDVEFDMLPDEAEQAQLVATVQRANKGTEAARLSSRRALVERYRGRIAAEAYPYKGYGVESKTLLKTVTIALVRAALTHAPSGGLTFNDYSAVFIREVLNAQFPAVAANLPSRASPEERVLQLIPDVYNPVILEPQKPMFSESRTGIIRKLGFRPDPRIILPLLHLPHAEIREQTGLSHRAFYITLRQAKGLLEASTTMEAAVRALEEGVQFDGLRTPPPLEQFSLRQRIIAPQLDRENGELAKAVGLKASQLSRDIESLLHTMNARTRIEAIIIARTRPFEPTEEELGNPALREFSPRERDVISMLYLPVGDIAEALSTSKTSILNTIRNLREKTGTENNVELAYELLERGITFDVPPPKKPWNAILDTEDKVRVATNLGPVHDTLAESVGLRPWEVYAIVPELLRDSGAETEVGFALMQQMYPPGKQVPHAENPNPAET